MATALDTIDRATTSSRRITHRTRGHRHGPITRLMSPGDLGEMLKPFVFLDLFEIERMEGKGFAPHPHSGIATLTTFLEGHMTYADSTGKEGVLTDGSVEWMRAGRGVWHAGEATPGSPMRGYQLWLALPPELELEAPESLYFDPASTPRHGPVRVLLGHYAGIESNIPLPISITYLHVQLADGERFTYQPELDHEVAFLALNSGRLRVGDITLDRELAVFAEGNAAIDVVAEGAVELVIGSAAKHPYPLVTGYYSVHTNSAALAEGERTIAILGRGAAVAKLQAR